MKALWIKAGSLRILPDGRVELIQRTRASFVGSFDVERFPFDRQMLGVEVFSQRYPAELVGLDYQQDDVDFSRVARGVALDGWKLGQVDLRRSPVPGWYGQTHSRVVAAVQASRDSSSAIAPIFVRCSLRCHTAPGVVAERNGRR